MDITGKLQFVKKTLRASDFAVLNAAQFRLLIVPLVSAMKKICFNPLSSRKATAQSGGQILVVVATPEV